MIGVLEQKLLGDVRYLAIFARVITMTAHDIVLGTDSGTFWTGNDSQPWLDDPREAKVFSSPREAWQAASRALLSLRTFKLSLINIVMKKPRMIWKVLRSPLKKENT